MGWIEDEVKKRGEVEADRQNYVRRAAENDAKIRELWGILCRKVSELPRKIRPEHKRHGDYEVLAGKGTLYLARTKFANIGDMHCLMIIDSTDDWEGCATWVLGIRFDSASGGFRVRLRNTIADESLTDYHIDTLIRNLCTTWDIKKDVISVPKESSLESSKSTSESESSCFIATAVYGANSVQVYLLRNFRDQILMKSMFGRLFVLAYISTSPTVANILKSHPKMRAITKNLLVNPLFRLLVSRTRIIL